MDAYGLNPKAVVLRSVWVDYTSSTTFFTLPTSQAVVVVAVTTLFITFVSTCSWAIVRFFVHRKLACNEQPDGLTLFARVLYRNASSAPGTIWNIIMMRWSWRNAEPRVHKLNRRLSVLTLPALINVIAFTAAGILSSKIAGRNYESHHLLLNPENCGIDDELYNSNFTGAEGARRKIHYYKTYLNNTQAARLYATNCYRSNSDTAACSMFPSRVISYEIDTVECPFGRDLNSNTLCSPYHDQAIRLTTPLLDTNTIFGINVPAKYGIEVRRSLTCAPINVTKYIRTDNQGFENATSYLELGPVLGRASYTYGYRPRTKNDSAYYQLLAVSSTANIWSPIDALKVAHSEVSIVAFMANSLSYLNPVKDPWFSANKYNNIIEPTAAYQADQDISVLGCVEQFQICNPNTGTDSRCTILGSLTDLNMAYLDIGLNEYQIFTAQRFGALWLSTSIWQSVNLAGVGTLLASQSIFGLQCPSLPADQWQTEVKFWFETGLAAMQAGILRYVKNPSPDSLAPDARLIIPAPNTVYEYFCHTQRIRNTGAFVSFSLTGILVTYIIGAVIILISWLLEPTLGFIRRGRLTFHKRYSKRDISRINDHHNQLLRKQLQYTSIAYGTQQQRQQQRWTATMKENPCPPGDQYFTLPEQQMQHGVVNDYIPSQPLQTELMPYQHSIGGSSALEEPVETTAVVVPHKADNEPVVVVTEQQPETQSLIVNTSENSDSRTQYYRQALQRSISNASAVSALTET